MSDLRGQQKQTRGGGRNHFGSRLLVALSLALTAVSYQNCGTDFVPLSEADFASLGFTCGADLEKSFERSYHQFFRSQAAKCSNCHGLNQTPQFAVDSVSLAFQNFQRVDQELIKTYALNPTHGGGAGGEQNRTAIATAESNYNSCKPTSTPNSVVITARTRPLILNATTTAALKSIDLSSQLEIGPAGAMMTGTQLHFITRLDLTGTTPIYEFRRPSLRTAASPIRVRKMFVLINGVRAGSVTQTFRDVNVLVGANLNPVGGNVQNPTLTGNIAAATMFLGYSNARAQDTIQFEFELLAPEALAQ